MITLDTFLPFILSQLQSCPDPMATQALRSACIDFCQRTDTVQRIQAPTDVTATFQDYTVGIPANMQLARVLEVAWQGKWLTVVPPDNVTSDVALRGADVGTAQVSRGSPQWFFQKTPDSPVVSLYPIPDTTAIGVLLIKASFKPTQTADTVDDQLFNDWCAEIVHGALAILKAMQGKPWSGDGSSHKTMFERGINAAKRQKFFGKTSNGARVMPRSFI